MCSFRIFNCPTLAVIHPRREAPPKLYDKHTLLVLYGAASRRDYLTRD